MRTRSRLEIYIDLLRTVTNQSDSVDIAKKANLTLSDTEKHLHFLASQGFMTMVRLDQNRGRYELSPRGLEALEALRELTEPAQPLLTHA